MQIYGGCVSVQYGWLGTFVRVMIQQTTGVCVCVCVPWENNRHSGKGIFKEDRNRVQRLTDVAIICLIGADCPSSGTKHRSNESTANHDIF